MNTPNNDGKLRETLEALKDFVESGSKAETMIEEALAAPARNIDVFRTRKEADEAYDKYAKYYMMKHFMENDFKSSCLDYEDWFFAEYEPECYAETRTNNDC